MITDDTHHEHRPNLPKESSYQTVTTVHSTRVGCAIQMPYEYVYEFNGRHSRERMRDL